MSKVYLRYQLEKIYRIECYASHCAIILKKKLIEKKTFLFSLKFSMKMMVVPNRAFNMPVLDNWHEFKYT